MHCMAVMGVRDPGWHRLWCLLCDGELWTMALNRNPNSRQKACADRQEKEKGRNN